jgi:hypothetical protein
MSIDTKPNLSNCKFEQLAGDSLYLSGCTAIYGDFTVECGATLHICPQAGLGKYLASDENGNATWQNFAGITGATNGLSKSGQNIILGGTLTGNTGINTDSGCICFTDTSGNNYFTVANNYVDISNYDGNNSGEMYVDSVQAYLSGVISTPETIGAMICASQGCNYFSACNYSTACYTSIQMTPSAVTFNGLPAKTTATCVLYIDGLGALSTAVPEGGGGDVTGATNGLTLSDKIVVLGGALTGNTSINTDAGNFIVTGSTLGCNNGLTITPSVFLYGYDDYSNQRFLCVDKCRLWSKFNNAGYNGINTAELCVDACYGGTKIIQLGDDGYSSRQYGCISESAGYLTLKTYRCNYTPTTEYCSSIELTNPSINLYTCYHLNQGQIYLSTGGIILLSDNGCGDKTCICQNAAAICVEGTWTNFAGIEYCADYSAHFSNCSLVNKGWVISQITGGTSVSTANNGLTKVGQNIALGGALTGNTYITNTDGYSFHISGNSGCLLFDGCHEYNRVILSAARQPMAFNDPPLINIDTTSVMTCVIPTCGANAMYTCLSYPSAAYCVNMMNCAELSLNSCNNISMIKGNCVLLCGSPYISGYIVDGTCSDSVLVWDSGTCQVHKVPYVSGATGGSSLSEFTITGNSTATGFTINHAKGKQFVAVEVVRGSSPYDTIYTNVQRPNANCVCVTFDSPPANGQEFKILIIS